MNPQALIAAPLQVSRGFREKNGVHVYIIYACPVHSVHLVAFSVLYTCIELSAMDLYRFGAAMLRISFPVCWVSPIPCLFAPRVCILMSCLILHVAITVSVGGGVGWGGAVAIGHQSSRRINSIPSLCVQFCILLCFPGNWRGACEPLGAASGLLLVAALR